MVTCPNAGYYEFYFWLCYGLSNAGKFKSYHRGTAIPFINIGDVRDLLRGVAPYFYDNWQRYKAILSALEKLEKYKATLSDQLRVTKNLQDTLLHQYFNNIKERGH